MCDLQRDSEQSQEGYKVVVKKKDGKYYSAAMGFRYRADGRVPVVKKQRKLSNWFNSNILNDTSGHRSGFSEKMVGRTAIFLDEHRAHNVAQTLTYQTKNGTVMVVKATVSKDVMLGTYGRETDVAAGRRIKFGEEILELEEEGGEIYG